MTIYGDPQSAGKWDGVWANAGFGSKCTLGMHDDTWARAVVVEVGDKTVAMVSLDVVGLFNIEVQRARRELALRYPDMEIDELVVSSTHTHEGVDTMGYWGQALGIDGKFPAYNAFVRSQLIDAVHEAYTEKEPALAKFAQTEFTSRDPRLPAPAPDRPVPARGSVRPAERRLDDRDDRELVQPPRGAGLEQPARVVGLPARTREILENSSSAAQSVYFSGSVGGLMTPFGVDILRLRQQRVVGTDLRDRAGSSPKPPRILGGRSPTRARRSRPRTPRVLHAGRQHRLNGFNAAGVFDIPTYIGANSWGLDGHTEGVYAGRTGPQFKTEMVAVEFGPRSS